MTAETGNCRLFLLANSQTIFLHALKQNMCGSLLDVYPLIEVTKSSFHCWVIFNISKELLRMSEGKKGAESIMFLWVIKNFFNISHTSKRVSAFESC